MKIKAYKNVVKLELVFIKHYVPNSLPLTVNSHHDKFKMPKFSKDQNSKKIRWPFLNYLIR